MTQAFLTQVNSNYFFLPFQLFLEPFLATLELLVKLIRSHGWQRKPFASLKTVLIVGLIGSLLVSSRCKYFADIPDLSASSSWDSPADFLNSLSFLQNFFPSLSSLI